MERFTFVKDERVGKGRHGEGHPRYEDATTSLTSRVGVAANFCRDGPYHYGQAIITRRVTAHEKVIAYGAIDVGRGAVIEAPISPTKDINDGNVANGCKSTSSCV